MEQSKSVPGAKKSTHRHHRSSGRNSKLNIPSSRANIDKYLSQIDTRKSKHSRNKYKPLTRPTSATFSKTRSWFNKSNSRSPQRSNTNTNITNERASGESYGYIQSLPTSATNHGGIYHPQYGMIVFTYNQALETARNSRRTNKYSANANGNISESDEKTNCLDLRIPSNTNTNTSSYHTYSAYKRNASPSPSPMPRDNNYDHGLSDINRLYIYQPVKFDVTNNIHSPICNVSECDHDDKSDNNIIDIAYNIISESPQPKTRRKSKKSHAKRVKRVFNDGDDTEPEFETENDNGYKARRTSRKSRYKNKYGPRPSIPVPLPPNKATNQKRHYKQTKSETNVVLATNQKRIRKKHNTDNLSLTLQPSRSLFRSLSRGLSRNRTNQKIASNVKVLNMVQNDDCNLYCFSPKGKHYKHMPLDHIIKMDPDDNETDIKLNLPSRMNSNVVNQSNTKNNKKKKKRKNDKNKSPKNKEKKRLKIPKFARRNKSSSDSLHKWKHDKNKKLITPFCPSMSQYYVRDACLLHWEGKNMDEIKQDGVKKCMTKKLFLEENSNDKVGENIFFSMTSDVETMCDELEEKINRLFNNNGGTIYIGITSKDVYDMNGSGSGSNSGSAHYKSNSFTFSKNKYKKNNDAGSIASVRDHVIVGIKLHSKTRYKLKVYIEGDILGGFTPQIPHLLQNFDLKFIPVISQSGKIISRYFVIKISVVAPILAVNGDKIQFRTKDGYAHVIDF